MQGTADDDAFESLEELQGISYVGPSALEKMLAYALSNGFGAPQEPAPLEEGSGDALAVLSLANRASEATLDEDVGLDRRAATNLVRYREGADGTAGTADDARFESLSELLDIAYVGPSALEKLRAYAAAHPPADELPVAACGGDFTSTEIQQAFRAGAWLDLGLQRHTRDCDVAGGVTSCTEWSATELPRARQATNGDTSAVFNAAIKVLGGEVGVEVTAASTTYRATGHFRQQPEGTQLNLEFTYRGFTDVCTDCSWGGGAGTGGCLRSRREYWDDIWMTLSGGVSEGCLVLATEAVRSAEVVFGEGNLSYTETVDMAVSQ
ncbi:MAG: hypothetical protein AB8I08_19500 [Sandaracinaceae bacterium]